MAYPYVPAKYMGGGLTPTAIVIHTMEAPEKGTTAESTARYFQTISRPASAHFCIDDNSIVQCVPDRRVAYHAPPANAWALGFEHAGYARQSPGEWADAFSTNMLLRSVGLAAEKCRQYGIHPVFLREADLAAGRRNGITTHALVSKVFKKSTHTDPGPSFPMDNYIYMVAASMGAISAPPAPSPAPGSPPPPAGSVQETLQMVALAIYGTKVEAAKKPFVMGDARHDGVKMIQAAIDKDPIMQHDKVFVTVDGDFGQHTYDAVRWYQGRYGLAPDGAVGPATIGMMYP